MKKTFLLLLLCALWGNVHSQHINDDVTVTVTPMATVQACATIETKITLTNSGANDFYDVMIYIPKVTGICYTNCDGFSCETDPVTGEFKILAGTLEKATSIDIYVTVRYTCDLIPVTPTVNPLTGQFEPKIVTETFNITHSQPGDILQHVSMSTIYFPFLEYSLNSNVNEDLYGNNGDIFTRSITYYNSGTADLVNGAIKFKDDHSGQIEVLNISVWLDSQQISSVSMTDSILFEISQLGAGKSITFEEQVRVVECLTPTAQSLFQISWGCHDVNTCDSGVPGPNDLCMNRESGDFSISRSADRPILTLTRIEPAGTPIQENACYGGYTHYKYRIKNDSAAGSADMAYNVRIGMEHFFQIFTILDMDSIRITTAPANAGDTIGYYLPYYPGLPNPKYLSAFYAADTSLIKPECLDQFPNALRSVYFVFDTLKVGDEAFIEFYTYRCCPNDTAFFDKGSPEYKFNRWAIGGAALDECATNSYSYNVGFSQNISLMNLSENLDGGAHYWAPNKYDLALKQQFEPTVTDLTGGVAQDSIDPAPWYGESSTFTIENIQFMRIGAITGDTNLVRISKAQLKVEIDMDKGLHILPSDLAAISIFKGSQVWNAAYVDTNQAYIYGDSKLIVYFNLEDVPDSIAPLKLEDARDFISGSSMQFIFTSYCEAAQPKAYYNVSVWLNPDTSAGCTTCLIALSQIKGNINVHCPGCITPGIIVDDFSLVRTSYGYEDVTNNGKADGTSLIPITSNYSQFGNLKLRRAVQGDTLLATVEAHFEDGSSTVGVVYDTLKAHWATNYGTPDKFEYLYLRQSIPFSNEDDLNLVLQDSVEVKIMRDSTVFIFHLDGSDTSDVIRSEDVYYYKLDRQKISSLPNAPPNFEFLPWDYYLIKSEFVVCGEFTPADPIYNPTVDARKVSEIVNQMYLTGIRQEVYDDEPLAVAVYGQYEEVDSLDKKLFYLCETYGGLFYFYSNEGSIYFPYGSSQRSCTHSLWYNLYSRYGGGEYNIFPYEFRPPVSRISRFIFPMPDNPYAYAINQINISGFGNVVSPVTGQYVNYGFNLNPGVSFDSLAAINTIEFDTSFYRPIMESDVVLNGSNSKLLVGDEYFQQTVQVILRTLCDGYNGDTTSKNTSATILKTVPGCDNSDVTQTGDSLYAFLSLAPSVTSTVEPLLRQATTQCICWEITLNNPPLAMEVRYPYLYFPAGTENVSFNSIYVSEFLSGSYSSNVCVAGNGNQLVGSHGFYNISGVIYPNTTRKFRVCANYNCTGIDSTYNMIYYYGGNCNYYPTDISDPELCHIYQDTMVVHENEAMIETDNSNNVQDETYNRCDDEHEFTGCVKSTRAGGVNDFKITVTIPPSVLFDSSDVALTYYNALGVPSVLVTSYLPDINTVTNQYIYDFDTLNSGYGSDQVLENNERLCFSFSYATTCDYTGALPTLLFEGLTYCDEITKAEPKFNPWEYIPDSCSSSCGPNCSLEVSCESTGLQLYGIVSGANGPVTYLWDTDPPQQTQQTNDLTPGIYTLVVTDSAGCQARCMIELFSCYGMRTQTQGGWGSEPSGGNPGTYLHEPNRFDDSFPAPAYLTVGCNNTIQLTSAQEVTNFLPCSGTPHLLPAGTMTDPGDSYNNTFAGQITALTISVNFDEDIADFGTSNSLLKDMTVNAGVFEGWKVSDVLLEANYVIGGCSSTYTVSSLNWTLSMINQNFVDGTQDNGFLSCGSGNSRHNWDNFSGSFEQIGLLAAYPNPFNDELNIDFVLESGGKIRLEIINAVGQVVEVPFAGYADEGALNSVHIQNNKLENGVYFCRLISEQGNLQVRLVRMGE